MDSSNLIKIPLKVVIDKERKRVVFAEANNDFVDVLFSFLTLPMGTTVRLLSRHSGQSKRRVNFGSFENLYKSILSTANTPEKHGACQRPLGHSGGGPPLDTCAQPAATPHPRTEGPGTPPDGAARSPELSFGARRRGAPSLGLGAHGFIFISKLLRESTFKPIHICSLKSWSVVCTFVVMERAGKSTVGRPSASTHIQDQDPSQVQEPGGDRETFQEQPLTQHTPIRDARNVIELNQYKYTNVPVAEEHMANLTSHELAEAIRLYRDE
ncbi:hypothetical protein AgCh_034505 [Apium graveolens]